MFYWHTIVLIGRAHLKTFDAISTSKSTRTEQLNTPITQPQFSKQLTTGYIPVPCDILTVETFMPWDLSIENKNNIDLVSS